jgi:hypothetical protein
MQVRYAFLAGLAVVLLLFPVNRWIALRIQSASVDMMACKDNRIRVLGELLRGMQQIKIAAWEGCFVERVSARFCPGSLPKACGDIKNVTCLMARAGAHSECSL